MKTKHTPKIKNYILRFSGEIRIEAPNEKEATKIALQDIDEIIDFEIIED